MHEFKESLELIEKEVKKINEKGTLSPSELENLKKAAEAVEVIQCILKNEEEDYEGYSERRGGNRSYRGSYRNYDRDYEHGGSRMMPMDRSYDRGMSRADSIQRSIDVLESMLDTAETEKERRAIRNHIEDLRR